ncbi:MAG TPA: phosphoesterase [Ktedonobacteraceae bacterium]|nr:phosphoesterase [Ktedonobacteraceae bacterium]
MAKQEEQKQKMDFIVHQGRPATTDVLPQVSATSTATDALPQTSATGIATDVLPQVDVASTIDQTLPGELEPDVEKHARAKTAKIGRRQLLLGGLGAAATAATLGRWLWLESSHSSQPSVEHTSRGPDVVIQWNNVALQAIRNLQPPMPVTARALAILHTSMFDAWAAYDTSATGTQLGTRLRRPPKEHTLINKAQAISYAAYHTLLNLFPTEQIRLYQFMTHLGYRLTRIVPGTSTPAGVGMAAAQAVLQFRNQDGSNQLGNVVPGAYADYTNYIPVNTPERVNDPNHWQPLFVPSSHFGFVTQQFGGAQWNKVLPFALSSSSQFLPMSGPPLAPSPDYLEQARQILRYSAGLTNVQKISAEYWANGPNQEQPPGHWILLAQFISQRARYTLDQNIKLFFILSNALLDTSIACWTIKRIYDSPYPLTVIHYLFRAQEVRAWAGPNRGTQQIDGTYWQPYQANGLITPPYPEYCSEHSSFSSAAAEILRRFTGNDRMNISYTQPAHSSQIEHSMPAHDTTLSWHTFTQAADEAGLSGRYSGMHFIQSDLDGRALGRQVSAQVWLKAQEYINSLA